MSVAKPLPHDSATLHVRGQARYVDDIPLPGDTLHLAFGCSDIAHGTITSIDLDAVRAADGVVAVLTADDLDTAGFDGAKYVCSPPPRDTASQAACFAGLEDGVFDVFSSDHCPFRYDDHEGKKHPEGLKTFKYVPNGIPGVETSLPILFSEGVSKGRIDLQRFVSLSSTNHAKMYGLYPKKGEIAVGSDADIALWDPTRREVLRQDNLHHGADYTPYEGIEVIGFPVRTILRGKTLVADGVLQQPKGVGHYLARAKSGEALEA